MKNNWNIILPKIIKSILSGLTLRQAIKKEGLNPTKWCAFVGTKLRDYNIEHVKIGHMKAWVKCRDASELRRILWKII